MEAQRTRGAERGADAHVRSYTVPSSESAIPGFGALSESDRSFPMRWRDTPRGRQRGAAGQAPSRPRVPGPRPPRDAAQGSPERAGAASDDEEWTSNPMARDPQTPAVSFDDPWGLPPTIKLPQRRRLCCCCCRGDSAATNFRERYRTGKLLCKPDPTFSIRFALAVALADRKSVGGIQTSGGTSSRQRRRCGRRSR